MTSSPEARHTALFEKNFSGVQVLGLGLVPDFNAEGSLGLV